MHADRSARVPHDVVGERDVLDHRPRRGALLVANGEHDGGAALRVRPIVLEDIGVDQDSLRVLELQEVLEGPVDSGITRIVHPPPQRFVKMITADLDVGRDETLDGGIRAAEQEVLASALQVVVDDLERPGAVPARNGLGVRRHLVSIRDVRVDDGGGGTVQRDAAPEIYVRGPMDVHPIEDEIVRHVGQRGRAVAEQDELVVQDDPVAHGELDADEPVVMRPGRGGERRIGVRADDLRQYGGVGRCHAGALGRQGAVWCRGPDDDPALARFVGQREVSGEARSGFEGDLVARLDRVERRLEVAGRRHGDRATRRRDIRRVDEAAGELGLDAQGDAGMDQDRCREESGRDDPRRPHRRCLAQAAIRSLASAAAIAAENSSKSTPMPFPSLPARRYRLELLRR